MREPNLQITVFLSFLIHATLLIIALATIKHTNHFVVPSPYIVRLVGPETGTINEKMPEKTAASQSPLPGISENQQSVKAEREYASERIAAMEAKRRIEKAFKLRDVISLKSSGVQGKSPEEASQPSASGSLETILSSYYAEIQGEIWQNWTFPETGDKNLESIISIIISRDGMLKINKIEKKSGNSLFDRSVINAVIKTKRVSPPPYEMEVGLRFTP